MSYLYGEPIKRYIGGTLYKVIYEHGTFWSRYKIQWCPDEFYFYRLNIVLEPAYVSL